jgi:hypothetical protein
MPGQIIYFVKLKCSGIFYRFCIRAEVLTDVPVLASCIHVYHDWFRPRHFYSKGVEIVRLKYRKSSLLSSVRIKKKSRQNLLMDCRGSLKIKINLFSNFIQNLTKSLIDCMVDALIWFPASQGFFSLLLFAERIEIFNQPPLCGFGIRCRNDCPTTERSSSNVTPQHVWV